MSLKLTVLLCLVAAVIAVPRRVTRLVGGHSVNFGDRPYYVAIYTKNSISNCGGAILNEQWIVTAAYCVIQITKPTENLFIKAGNIYYNKTSERQQTPKIAAIFVNPDFDAPVGPNDVALVKLETPLKFNDFVKPIDLPAVGSIPTGYGTVTGLGSLRHMSHFELPEVLQTVDLPIIDNNACDKLLDTIQGDMKDFYNLLDETRFCTGLTPTNQGYCMYDTGDPFIVNDELVGIATYGFAANCELDNAPSIFTRVSAHLDWIKNTMDKN